MSVQNTHTNCEILIYTPLNIKAATIKGAFDERRRAMSLQDTHTNCEILIQKIIKGPFDER